MSTHIILSCWAKLGFVHTAIYSVLYHTVPGLEGSEDNVLAIACYLFTETTCELLKRARTMSGCIYIYLEDSIVAVEGEQATLTASCAVQSDLTRSGLVGNVNMSSLELAHSVMYLALFYIDLAK